MAAGYTKVTNRPQAVMLHATAGPLNAAMTLRAALQERTPMVIISGEIAAYGENTKVADPGGQWLHDLTDLGGDRYELHIDADHEGWSGVILISGQGPFPQEVVAPPVGARGPTWQQQFLSMAAERGWRVEMIWYESVNRQREGQPAQREEFGAER